MDGDRIATNIAASRGKKIETDEQRKPETGD